MGMLGELGPVIAALLDHRHSAAMEKTNEWEKEGPFMKNLNNKQKNTRLVQ